MSTFNLSMSPSVRYVTQESVYRTLELGVKPLRHLLSDQHKALRRQVASDRRALTASKRQVEKQNKLLDLLLS